MDLGQVGASLKSSQDFQMKLMMMQNEHSKIMAAINAMKQAADKIRA
jgi:hypothetical protein